ncbi:hypothetical protein COBT_003729, partial [Conglomerata obtusa]
NSNYNAISSAAPSDNLATPRFQCYASRPYNSYVTEYKCNNLNTTYNENTHESDSTQAVTVYRFSGDKDENVDE